MSLLLHEQKSTGHTTQIPPHTLAALTSTDVEVYEIVLKEDEDGRFVATCPTLSVIVTDGATEDEALDNAQEAVQAFFESQGIHKEFILFVKPSS